MATIERSRVRVVLAVLLVAATVYAFTQTLVGPALPALAESLDVSVDTVSWLFTSFLLSACVATPLIGRLGDTHDRGKVLCGVLLLFALGGVISTLTTLFPVVLAGRLVQGVAGGVLPLAYGVVKDMFPEDRVAPSIGLMGTTFGVGGGLGLPLSGILVDAGLVRWLFLSSLLAVPPAIAAYIVVPRSEEPQVRRRMDLPGTILLSVGLVMLLLGLNRSVGWGVWSDRVLALVLGSFVLFALLAWVELRHPDPLVNVRVLRTRPMVATNAVTLLTGGAAFANFLLTSQFAQAEGDYGFGYSATAAGMLMLSSSVTTFFAGPLVNRVGPVLGMRNVLAGGALCAGVGTAFPALAYTQPWHFVLSGALMGLGAGLVLAASANLVVHLVSEEEVGVATGLNTVFRTIGAALASVVLASVLAASVGPEGGQPTVDGFRAAYLVGGCAGALGCLIAFAVPSRRSRIGTSPVVRRPVEATSPVA